MNDLIIRLLVDGTLIAAVGAIIGFLVKHWVTAAIDHRYSLVANREKAVIDIEKQRGLELLKIENAIYPQLVEFTYRLRNRFRERLEGTRSDWRDPSRWNAKPKFISFGEELYLLTENLYKYRAYLNEDVFQDLHAFKRNLQDAEVLFDRINRALPSGQEKLFEERVRDSIQRLEGCYLEIEKFWPDITKKIKAQMRSVLDRDGNGNPP